ncbi:unnamed protein product [Thlaspi arvense]|uniref:Uncharacterized protein n=1 Tax=Thlaspi arvense TaxID=13288 RepID=A0AAU9SIS6_THLAR|nr:unnamed protein product [Thlaspi arvense]
MENDYATRLIEVSLLVFFTNRTELKGKVEEYGDYLQPFPVCSTMKRQNKRLID